MYGLVFEIVEEWVIEKQGLETWHAIKKQANCEVKDQSFLRRAYYRDEELVDIINAASDLLSISVPDILEAFGHYVIRHHFDNGYDDLLRAQGSTLRQWLSNLNAMHDHVQKSFPGENFVAPIFWCEDCDEVEGSILLHYYSLRGVLLVPMVVGIVEELAEYHFDVQVKMDRLALQDEDGASFTTWRLTAVDHEKRWKLSPKVNSQSCGTDVISFDGVEMPSKCPFTGRKLKDSSTTDDNEEPAKMCPFAQRQMEKQNATTRENIGLSVQKMKEVFPFHVLVDREFSIIQVGKSLPNLLGREIQDFDGIQIWDILEITRPVLGSSWNWKSLSKLSDQTFFLTPVTRSSKTLQRKVSMLDSIIKFKASMIQLSTETVMFTLTPDARNVVELNNMGLTLSDLPLQSCQRDAIFLGEYVAQEADKAHKLDKLSKRLVSEKNLSNTLLYNMLPKQVADDLRKGKTIEPTFHENVTLFFSDIEGFTQICDQVEPWAVIDMMNQLYSVMDYLASHFELYKVETVGDSYMCCSGLPEPEEFHAEKIANFALAVVECVKHVKSPCDGKPISLRIGIHTGSCTSGVVGTMTPHYCLFGDMVNVTSRHESTGVAGKVQCSSVLFGRLKHFSQAGSPQYNFTARGLVDMKGKGEHYTYWLESGTESNSFANPEALEKLSDEVQTIIASKKWKMRRYFGRNRLLRDSMSLGYTDSSATTDGSYAYSSGASSNSKHDSSLHLDQDSVNSDDSDLEPDIEDDDFEEEMEEYLEDRLQRFENEWYSLKWDESLSPTDVLSKMVDILFSTLLSCLQKEGEILKRLDVELHEFVHRIANIYSQENSYHNFQHAKHVFLLVNYLYESMENTLGLSPSPWDRFILLFSALIKDSKHTGVHNAQLQVENNLLYKFYQDEGSYQQRNSFDTAFRILEEEFETLYEEIIFGCPNFRSSVRKVVLSADVDSKHKLKETIDAFERVTSRPCIDDRIAREQNVARLGLILAMASVGHYSQSYEFFLHSNGLQFQEQQRAYKAGRGEDPQETWFYDQSMFFNDAILPLISHVERILPRATYLGVGAKKNIDLWETSGKEFLAASMLPSAKVEDCFGTNDSKNQFEKLVSANVLLLEGLLQDIIANQNVDRGVDSLDEVIPARTSNPYDEIQLVIEMKRKGSVRNLYQTTELPQSVKSELYDFVTAIASGYKDNAFHNFLHASHVTHMANLLLTGIHGKLDSKDASGIAHDPLARFSIVFSALVHDVGHVGVPNGRLAEEQPELAKKYSDKSIAEQNSIDTAWDILMSDCFRNLRKCLFDSTEERERLRQLLVNCVMATDIFDSDLRALRKSRWEKVFAEDASLSSHDEECDCKATIVIERIMQASDVAHTMQQWDIYRQWNESLFHEMYEAFIDGRAEKDPSEGWYKGELWFFDNWVIPLAQDLKECGVLDIVSDQLVKQARSNRLQWEAMGEEISKSMLEKAKMKGNRRRYSSIISHASTRSVNTTGTEALLTSHIVSEVESLSKVVKKYERKMEAACGNLIAVAYKGQPGARELRRQSWAHIHRHFKQQDWYRMYSDDEASIDGSETDEVTSIRSIRGGRKQRVQIVLDDVSSLGSALPNLRSQLSIAENILNGQ